MFKAGKDGFLKFFSGIFEPLRRDIQAPAGLVPTPIRLVRDEAEDARSGDREPPRVKPANGDRRDSQELQVSFESESQRFLQWCHANVGAAYVWPTEENRYSGKGLPGATYPGTFDCSGFVTAGLYRATKGKIDMRSHGSAQRLWDTCRPCGGTGLCLAFYGTSNRAISHVVVVLPDGRVVGQSKGDSTCTTPAIALARGARVTYHQSATYRHDLRGFRALPLSE